MLLSDDVAEVALPAARCSTRLEARYGAAADVPVETRGAGNASRQVTNFGVPGVWEHAEKLVCCRADHAARQLVELPTAQARRVGAVRGGQRGDLLLPDRRTRPGHPVPRRRAATTGPTPAPSTRRPGWRRSTRPSRCATTTWCSSRTATTVRAWRRTGYPMYYLNVMAGPADERALAFCDDPAHGWVRDSWSGVETDPRCPVTSASGRTDGLVPSYDDDTPQRLGGTR